MNRILTELDIEKLANEHKYTEGFYRDHFMFGGTIVNNHYKKEFDEIQKMVYGHDKNHWVRSHLLRFFSTDGLINIRDFLIERTPKIIYPRNFPSFIQLCVDGIT